MKRSVIEAALQDPYPRIVMKRGRKLLEHDAVVCTPLPDFTHPISYAVFYESLHPQGRRNFVLAQIRQCWPDLPDHFIYELRMASR